MKKIGEGYFYEVYDLGNGRVLKRQKGMVRMFLYIFVVNWFLPRSFREYRTARVNKEKIKAINHEVYRRIVEKDIIGNPSFRDGIDYDQDKAIPVRILLREKKNELDSIDRCIELIHRCWEYGCHERVFNFSINTGMNGQGTLILFDFNEMSFDLKDAQADIEASVWLRRMSYWRLPSRLRAYYRKRMAEELTHEKLKVLWERKLLNC